jgi:hypothetical protein
MTHDPTGAWSFERCFKDVHALSPLCQRVRLMYFVQPAHLGGMEAIGIPFSGAGNRDRAGVAQA